MSAQTKKTVTATLMRGTTYVLMSEGITFEREKPIAVTPEVAAHLAKSATITQRIPDGFGGTITQVIPQFDFSVS